MECINDGIPRQACILPFLTQIFATSIRASPTTVYFYVSRGLGIISGLNHFINEIKPSDGAVKRL